MKSYVISSLKDPLTGETGLKLKNGQIEVAEVGAPSRANCCCPCETFECPDGACGIGCCCVNGQCVKKTEIPEEQRCPDCPCPEGETCVDGQCGGCPPERVCGEDCCPEGETCVNGQCQGGGGGGECDPPCDPFDISVGCCPNGDGTNSCQQRVFTAGYLQPPFNGDLGACLNFFEPDGSCAQWGDPMVSPPLSDPCFTDWIACTEGNFVCPPPPP